MGKLAAPGVVLILKTSSLGKRVDRSGWSCIGPARRAVGPQRGQHAGAWPGRGSLKILNRPGNKARLLTLDRRDRTGLTSPREHRRTRSLFVIAAARNLSALVRKPRLVAARASAGAARKSPRRPLGALDRAHRRRQDARGFFADAGGAARHTAAFLVTSPLVGEVDARRAAGGG